MTPQQKSAQTRTENSARSVAEAAIARYGVISALSRYRIIRHEYPAKRQPHWLTRTLEILEAEASKLKADTPTGEHDAIDVEEGGDGTVYR